LPGGAGAVVPWEQVSLAGNRVVLPGEIVSGSNIKQQGEDFMAGELLARRGTRLGPGRIGVLAAMGKREVPVFRRPRVTILSLGRGVVPCQTLADGGLVWDSNGPLLASLVSRDGGQLIGVEVSGGEACAGIGDRLKELIPQSDLVLTIGGAASGTDDQALFALRGIGARVLFWGMRVKPGSHSGAAVMDSRLVISLPGNPAACAVAYQLLASTALHALQGLDPYPQRLSAQCTGSFPKKGGPRRFLRGYVFYREDGWAVNILPGQKSSMLRSLVEWNALVELPAGHTPLEAGTPVSVLLLSPIPLAERRKRR
jgi:molybdopterin molybdotransferase